MYIHIDIITDIFIYANIDVYKIIINEYGIIK